MCGVTKLKATLILIPLNNMIEPTKGNILIEPTDTLREVAGLKLPDQKTDATEGKVIRSKVEQFKEGDYVYFSKYCINGREIKENNEVKYVILKEEDILAVKK